MAPAAGASARTTGQSSGQSSGQTSPQTTGQTTGQPAGQPAGLALPSGVALRKRRAVSDDILVLSFDLDGKAASQPVGIEAYRTNGKIFLKTRSDVMKNQTGWRSGSDQHGNFFLCYETDLAQDAPDTLAVRLSRYCFASLNAV